MIEEHLFDVLSAVLPDSVYRSVAPQENCYPVAVFNRVSTRINSDISGCIGSQSPVYQIDIYSRSPTECRDLEVRITAVMIATDKFKAVKISDFDDYDSNERLHRIMLEFSIWELI